MLPFKKSTTATGKHGETLAADFLISQGYTILRRNYRRRNGEIDIIARDKEIVVFVEVKTRSTTRFGSGFEAVDYGKQRKLVKTAADFLYRHNLTDTAARFDVVSVTLLKGEKPHIELIKNAIEIIEP